MDKVTCKVDLGRRFVHTLMEWRRTSVRRYEWPRGGVLPQLGIETSRQHPHSLRVGRHSVLARQVGE
jgi:hypothetical protein